MANPLVIVRPDVHGGVGLWIWCPGCDEAHRPKARDPVDGSTPGVNACWDWNGATDETFTISPSLLCQGRVRCHSFIRDGHWEFLTDCEHPLVGQRVPMVPVPNWLVSLY